MAKTYQTVVVWHMDTCGKTNPWLNYSVLETSNVAGLLNKDKDKERQGGCSEGSPRTDPDQRWTYGWLGGKVIRTNPDAWFNSNKKGYNPTLKKNKHNWIRKWECPKRKQLSTHVLVFHTRPSRSHRPCPQEVPGLPQAKHSGCYDPKKWSLSYP